MTSLWLTSLNQDWTGQQFVEYAVRTMVEATQAGVLAVLPPRCPPCLLSCATQRSTQIPSKVAGEAVGATRTHTLVSVYATYVF